MTPTLKMLKDEKQVTEMVKEMLDARDAISLAVTMWRRDAVGDPKMLDAKHAQLADLLTQLAERSIFEDHVRQAR